MTVRDCYSWEDVSKVYDCDAADCFEIASSKPDGSSIFTPTQTQANKHINLA